MVEKDPFGDKLREKERADEDRYFAERDRALLEKIRARSEESKDATIAELCKGRCPRCGERLGPMTLDGITIEQCGSCQGIWLNQGELETLSRRESEGWLGRFFRHRLEEIR